MSRTRTSRFLHGFPQGANAASVRIVLNDGREMLGALSTSDLYEISFNTGSIATGYELEFEQVLHTSYIHSGSLAAITALSWWPSMDAAVAHIAEIHPNLTLHDVGREEAGASMRQGERLVGLTLASGDKMELYDLSSTSGYASHASTADWLFGATLLRRDPVQIRRSAIMEERDLSSAVSRHRS